MRHHGAASPFSQYMDFHKLQSPTCMRHLAAARVVAHDGSRQGARCKKVHYQFQVIEIFIYIHYHCCQYINLYSKCCWIWASKWSWIVQSDGAKTDDNMGSGSYSRWGLIWAWKWSWFVQSDGAKTDDNTGSGSYSKWGLNWAWKWSWFVQSDGAKTDDNMGTVRTVHAIWAIWDTVVFNYCMSPIFSHILSQRCPSFLWHSVS